MHDVARLAGVSHQTVSRVVNGGRDVSRPTRERVERAIRALDYRPNPIARALVTGRSRMLGVILFETSVYGPRSVMVGIERAAQAAGYSVSTICARPDDRIPTATMVDSLQRQPVEAIIVVAPAISACDEVAAAAVPVVVVGGARQLSPCTVAFDQYAGAERVTRHLLDLGHRTVWHISGPHGWDEAEQRRAGWLSALRAAGAEAPPELVGDWSAGSGYDVGRQLAAMPGVTAVFAGNDRMAVGVLRALSEAGRSVPGDVSVVGFDDIPEAGYLTPPLTTVGQAFTEAGRYSVHLALRGAERMGEVVETVVLPTVLVTRDSSGPRRPTSG